MVKSNKQMGRLAHKQTLLRADGQSVDWRRFGQIMPYERTLADMERHVAHIHEHKSNEQIWLLEHSPLYTAGTSAQSADLLSNYRFPVFETGRGGEYTYHGPGQRVCYAMLDLNQRGKDVRQLIASLESWLIKTLDHFGVKGEIRENRVGVWVARPEKPPVKGAMREDKIAAIGIRVRRWVTFHGLSLNVCPDLEHYSGIVPCGISGHGVTSLHDLGIKASMEEVDEALKEAFIEVFGSPLNEIEAITQA